MSEPMETAERVLALVDGGLEAQVVVRRGTEALTRFANSFIHQNVAESANSVSLQVTADGATASASVDQVDDEALRALVERCTAAARLQPADPDWPGLAGPAPMPETTSYDEHTAATSPDERAALVRAFVDAAGGLETAGFASTSGTESVFANSAGQRASGRTTVATMDGVARTGRSDGSGRASSVRIGDIDAAALGAAAADRAQRAIDATDLEPGHYEVVLEPNCVADILAFLDIYGFNGRAVNEHTSFVELGAQQFDEAIDIWDDATDPRLPGLPFDADGTPKRRQDLVRGGVTTSVVHDRRTGRQAGTESTGHAIEGGRSFGAAATNLFLGGGTAPREELIGGVQRGLLVTDFWYTRILDPRTQVVTGLTRNGVFLIENGVVGAPVTNMRFTQSYVEALSPGHVLGVGSDLQPVESQFGFIIGVPSLRLQSWNFTGGAKG